LIGKVIADQLQPALEHMAHRRRRKRPAGFVLHQDASPFQQRPQPPRQQTVRGDQRDVAQPGRQPFDQGLFGRQRGGFQAGLSQQKNIRRQRRCGSAPRQSAPRVAQCRLIGSCQTVCNKRQAGAYRAVRWAS
jgi:hypothetical protein